MIIDFFLLFSGMGKKFQKSRKPEKIVKKDNLSVGGFFATSALPGGVDPTKLVALDCEMVGGLGKDLLARVSVVGFSGKVLIDDFVNPSEPVKDYRTDVTGVDYETLKRSGKPLKEVLAKTHALLKDKIIIGHGLDNDMEILSLKGVHPTSMIRDTAGFSGLRLPGREKKIPSLKNLVSHWLGKSIQAGSHSSVEDARAALALYKKVMADWEKEKPEKINKSEKVNKSKNIIKKTEKLPFAPEKRKDWGEREKRRKEFWLAKKKATAAEKQTAEISTLVQD